MVFPQPCLRSRSPLPTPHPQVAHAIHLLTFFCLQLPVFTYLITQFQAVGREVRTFTYGEISATTAICVGAAVLLLCDLLGGMRAVAYTGGRGSCPRPALAATPVLVRHGASSQRSHLAPSYQPACRTLCRASSSSNS